MKIAFIVSRVPFPLEKGDKLRAYHQIKKLSEKHELHLIALNDSELNPSALPELKKYCASVSIYALPGAVIAKNLVKNIFTKLPFQVAYFTHSPHQKAIKQRLLEIQPDIIYYQLIRTCEYAKELEYPAILDYMDALSEGMKQKAKRAFLLSPLFYNEYRRSLSYESQVFERFHTKTIISEQDRQLIDHPGNKNIHVIPNGVDTNYFAPVDGSSEYDVLFTGNMNYPPNIDAALFLAKEIMPLVRKIMPSTRLLIAGANPNKKVLKLRSRLTLVSGWVDDIRACYGSSKIFVAPMRMGTGLQNKLLEAMSMNLPCITSSMANKALQAPEGKMILLADAPRQYADHIIYLLQNNEKRLQMGREGRSFVIKHFDWENTVARLAQLLEDAVLQDHKL